MRRGLKVLIEVLLLWAILPIVLWITDLVLDLRSLDITNNLLVILMALHFLLVVYFKLNNKNDNSKRGTTKGL